MAAATFKMISSSSSDQPQFDFNLLPTTAAQLAYDIPTMLLFPIRPQSRPGSEFKTLNPPILHHHAKKKTPLPLDLSLSINNFSDHKNYSSKKRPLVTADFVSKTPILKKNPVSLELSLSRPDHNSSKKRPLVADSGSKAPILKKTPTPPVSLDLSLSSGSSGSHHHQENHNKRMKFQVRPRNKNRTDRELLLGFNGPFWSIKKTLTKSDLGHLSRLIVASEDVQKSIIQFWDADRVGKVESEEGVMVRFWDCDTNSEHAMVFKRWKSSGSYVFNKNWIQQFVNRRGLKKGDQIGMSWDQGNSRFNFSLLKRA